MSVGRILVTRPAQQADAFIDRLTSSGFRALKYPAIEISPIVPDDGLRTLLGDWQQMDLAIFISVNAVKYARPYLNHEAYPEIAAIGARTASELVSNGFEVGLQPDAGFNSEALLGMPALADMQDRNVLLIKGEGGRDLLRDELQRRGASVYEAVVYRRSVTSESPEAVIESGSAGEIGLITLTSVEALNALTQVLGGERWLLQTPLLAGSQRIAEAARELGYISVINAEDPSDESMFHAVLQWASQEENDS